MVYGSVEYLNDKKNKVDTEHFPGCLLALYICNSDLRRWKKAGGGVVWRSEQQPEQSPNCQNHVVVKFFDPRGFDSWRGWLLLASTTWELSEPRGAMMQIIIVQLLIIIDHPAGIVAPSCLVRQRPAGNQHSIDQTDRYKSQEPITSNL